MGRVDLRELGELGLVELIRRRAGAAGRAWRLGIGDDAAVLRPRTGREIVVTADALIEDVHFRWSTTDARALGHKSLAVNLSDVAAMGARPLGFVATLGLPGDTPPERLGGFLDGLLSCARTAGCPLVGGDAVGGHAWAISITALGEVPAGRALRRDGARAGDRVLVTGSLGASGFGLRALESGGARDAGERRFVRRHLRPTPPLGAGPALLRRGWATSAIDLSDGLLLDLRRVAHASGVGATLDLDAVPLARGLAAACERRGLDALELALAGGEDYELCFTAGVSAPSASVLSRRLECPVTEVGRIRRGRGVELTRGTRPAPLEAARFEAASFEHFARAPDEPQRPSSSHRRG